MTIQPACVKTPGTEMEHKMSIDGAHAHFKTTVIPELVVTSTFSLYL